MIRLKFNLIVFFSIDAATKDAVMEYIDICLCKDSFVQQLLHCSLPGLANGGLLLCGAKGSGKTSIGLAICSATSTVPYYAFVETVDCKMLKGSELLLFILFTYIAALELHLLYSLFLIVLFE